MNTPLADREAVMNIRLAMDGEALTEDAYREALTEGRLGGVSHVPAQDIHRRPLLPGSVRRGFGERATGLDAPPGLDELAKRRRWRSGRLPRSLHRSTDRLRDVFPLGRLCSCRRTWPGVHFPATSHPFPCAFRNSPICAHVVSCVVHHLGIVIGGSHAVFCLCFALALLPGLSAAHYPRSIVPGRHSGAMVLASSRARLLATDLEAHTTSRHLVISRETVLNRLSKLMPRRRVILVGVTIRRVDDRSPRGDVGLGWRGIAAGARRFDEIAGVLEPFDVGDVSDDVSELLDQRCWH